MPRFLRQALCLLACMTMGGCAVDPLEDLPSSTADTTTLHLESIKAWLWALDSTSDSVRLVHTVDKRVWETHALPFAAALPFQEAEKIGGFIYPSWWTYAGNTVYSFTNGILDHGDHGHIVRALQHATITFPNDTIYDLQVSPDGQYLFAALGHNLVRIHYADADTLRLSMATTPRKLAFLSTWALIINDSNKVHLYNMSDFSSTTDSRLPTFCQDAWADSNADLFWIACGTSIVKYNTATDSSFIVLSTQQPVVHWSSSYSAASALGLPAMESCSTSLVAISTANQQVYPISITDACFPGSTDIRKTDISEDGSTALVADTRSPLFYRIDLKNGAATRVNLAHKALAVALNYDGTRAWYLANAMVYQVSFDSLRVVDSIAVAPGTSVIAISSFLDNGALFDADDHTF